ncbi:PEP-CTERM sorting domain-containing protein [Halobacteriales archaeon Cl-PHB]
MSEFTVVLDVGNTISTTTVSVDEADETFDSNHPNFGVEGYTGYKFDLGVGETQVIGLLEPDSYINPNYDIDQGSCGNAMGVVTGQQYDWTGLIGTTVGSSDGTATSATEDGNSLIGGLASKMSDVPAIGTMLLFGIGAVGILTVRRRHR